MGRILAIDYGIKRCGLAVSDPLRIIANPLDCVHSAQLIEFINQYVSREKVDIIVIGKPMRMHNEPSEIENHIKGLVKKLKKIFPEIEICRYDERFTSLIASQTIAQSGLKKKDRQKKELTDKVSAVLILQSYMEYISRK